VTDRYDVSDLREGQFEPGSNEQVLLNKLGITSVDEMNAAETSALATATEEFVHRFDAQHRFTVDDIQNMHRRWPEASTTGLATTGRSTWAKADFSSPPPI